jgi:hypothetical protein
LVSQFKGIKLAEGFREHGAEGDIAGNGRESIRRLVKITS